MFINVHAVSLWNDKNVLELVVKVAQPVNILKTTKRYIFKMVHFRVCELQQ